MANDEVKLLLTPLQRLGDGGDGPWHTAIAVFGREFHFFDTGVEEYKEGRSNYREPKHVVTLARTGRTLDELRKHIDQLKKRKFNQTTYKVLNNNCNHFSSELSEYLVNKELPHELKEQAKRIAGETGAALLSVASSLGSGSSFSSR